MIERYLELFEEQAEGGVIDTTQPGQGLFDSRAFVCRRGKKLKHRLWVKSDGATTLRWLEDTHYFRTASGATGFCQIEFGLEAIRLFDAESGLRLLSRVDVTQL